jgi:hypothetical protein
MVKPHMIPSISRSVGDFVARESTRWYRSRGGVICEEEETKYEEPSLPPRGVGYR